MNGMRPATQFLMGCLLLVGSAANAQVPIVDLQTRPGWYVIDGAVAGGHAGAWLHMGDLTGDFFNKELIVGLPGSDSSTGAVRIFLGRGSALGDMTTANGDALFTGAAPGDRFGAAVDAGYVLSPEIQLHNGTPVGPTYPRDLIVGAPGAFGGRGAVYIFTGAIVRNSTRSTAQAAFTIRGALVGDQLGAVIDSMDFNGDGYREVILAVPNRGVVYVLDVRNAGGTTADLSVAIPGGYLTGLGSSIAIAGGDVTGDGALDLVVGDPTRDGGRGAVYFFASRPRVLSGALPLPSAADAILAGIDAEDQFGASLWVADIDDDADPASEVIIGAPGADAPGNGRPDAGEVHIVWGSANPAAAFRSGLVLYGAAPGHRLGALVTAGHVTRKSPWDIVMLARGANGGAGELYAYYGRHAYDFPSAAADMATSASRRIISDEAAGPVQTVRVWETTGEGAEEIVIGVPTAAASAGAEAGRVYIAVSPRLNLSTGAVTLRAVRCAPGVAEFEISNPSAVPVPWRLYDPPAWVEIQPATGTTSVLAPSRVKLVTRTSSLAPGTYSQRVEILSNGPHLGHSAAIQISLTVDVPSPRAASAHVDFNGDGCGDVALFAASSGTWRIPDADPVHLGGPGDVPVPGDYDGDWVADPAVFRPSDGTWRFANGNVVTWGKAGDIPVPADYDGDGRMDIAVFERSSATFRVMGRSAVQWGQVGDLPVPGDYDGDGRADYAVYRRGVGEWLIQGQPTVTWGGPADVPVPADYDGDGDDDIAVYARATAEWRIKDQLSVTFGSAGDLPSTTDVDRDGRADLVVWNRRSSTATAYSVSSGVTHSIPGAAAGEIPVFSRAHLLFSAPGDVSGDGQSDLIWQHTGGTAVAWNMNGTSLLGGSAFQPAMTDPSWKLAATADFDLDGQPDLLWRHTSGNLVVWLMNGMTMRQGRSLGTISDPNWRVASVGDLNGDGHVDVLWQHANGQLAAWLLNGTTVIGGSSIGPGSVTPDWLLAGSADVNADGNLDLYWRHRTTGQVLFWIMRGATFVRGQAVSMSVGNSPWQIGAVLDLDADGWIDLVWYNPQTAAVVYWRLDGDGRLIGSGSLNAGASNGWAIIGPR